MIETFFGWRMMGDGMSRNSSLVAVEARGESTNPPVLGGRSDPPAGWINPGDLRVSGDKATTAKTAGKRDVPPAESHVFLQVRAELGPCRSTRAATGIDIIWNLLPSNQTLRRIVTRCDKLAEVLNFIFLDVSLDRINSF